MESLCEFIDGATSSVVATLLEIIRYSIESNNVNDIPAKYFYLKNITNCRIIAKVEKEVRIETSLLIFCILSYIIIKRNDIIKLIEKMLVT